MINIQKLLEECRPAIQMHGIDPGHFEQSVLKIKDTTPKMLLERYKEAPSELAMRKKDFGIWNSYTWEHVYQNIKHIALGLQSLGFQRGDKVCIVGDNDPEWYWAAIASQCLGGACVGIYIDALSADMDYIANDSDSVFVFSKDQEQTDKWIDIRDKIPNIKKVIYWDNKGMYAYRGDPLLLELRELMEIGRDYEKSHPDFFVKSIEAGKVDDLALMCYTSGTTGMPKGVMVSYEYIISAAVRLSTCYIPQKDDEYLSFVPPAWMAEQLMIVNWVIFAPRCNFPEAPETAQENIREIGARYFLWGPAQWEGINKQVQMKIFDTGKIRRLFYNLSLSIGYKAAEDRNRNRGVQSLQWKILLPIANALCLTNLRDNLGLNKLRFGLTGGSALGPDVISWYEAIGVRIKNSYGLTELTPCTLHRQVIKVGTCGEPVPGVYVKVSPEGEILAKSDAKMFDGYYKKPKETAAMLTEDGWIKTGDCGTFDEDGHLIVYDRMKEMLSLKGGGTYSPTYIQNRLKFSPYIKEVLIVGGAGREWLFAIVTIDFNNVGKWAEKNRISYTTFVDLSQKEAVYQLIRKDIIRVNATLPENAQVVRCTMLHKEFDADEGELTKSGKIRRTFLENRYADLIEQAYTGGRHINIETEVKYRDGRIGKVRTDVKIYTVKEDK